VASLEAIRDGLKITLKANIANLHVYDTVPDVTNLPAIVVMPDPENTVDFTKAFQRGHDEWRINLFVLVPRVDARAAQEQLDKFLAGSGPKSVRQVIYQHPEIGLSDGTDVTVTGAKGYGGNFDSANTSMVGVVMRLTVLTPGTA
jgi:hypothetical protein